MNARARCVFFLAACGAIALRCTDPAAPPGGVHPPDPCPAPVRLCPDGSAATCRDTGWYCAGDPAPGCDTLWIRDTMVVRGILDTNGMTTVGVWEVVLPGEYDTCGRIVRLDLSTIRTGGLSGGRGRPLQVLPASVGQLDRLRTLDVHNCRIGSLPAAIGQLRLLRELKVHRCGLTQVPDEICGLDSLAVVYLTDNGLERLPDSIGRLRQLVQLELMNNALDSLPLSIMRLAYVKGRLTVSGNYLCTAPPHLAAWLDTVAYEAMGWRAAQTGCSQALADTMAVRAILDNAGFPATGAGEVATLNQGRVVSLDLSARGLSAVPAQVFALTGLRRLDLSRNDLSALGGAIDSLRALRALDLSGNAITSPGLPALGRLAELQDLDLSGNALTAAPSGLDALDSLRTLDLSDNLLDTLSLVAWVPPAGLVTLDLSGNALGRLPLALGALRRLQSLDISGNAIDSLRDVDGLGNVRVMRASRNRLVSLPRLDSLRAVEVLDVSWNSLAVLPPTVGALAALDTLDFSNNALASLPQEIAALTGPLVVRCAGNRLCRTTLTPLVQLWLTQYAESNWDSLQTCP